jgi:hypothetical protein
MSSAEADRKAQESNEAWGGILAFVVGLALAVGGYLGAGMMIEANRVQHWVSLPAELGWPPSAPFLALKLAVGLAAMLIGGALVTLVYGLAYPVGPGEHDAPATRLSQPRSRR